MKAGDIVNTCENYFSGFADVSHHKSASQVILGILKIVSYALIIPPIVFAITYFVNKKVAVIESTLDGLIDSRSDLITSEIYQTTVPGSASIINSTNFVSYLVSKVANLKTGDAQEIARFQKGFRLLDFEPQAQFFEAVRAQGIFAKIIDILPTDVKELNFTLGNRGKTNLVHWDEEESAKNAKLFLDKLPSFTELEKLHLNLKGLGLYNPGVERSLKLMHEASGDVHAISGNDVSEVNWHGATVMYVNDSGPLIKAIIALRDYLKVHPTLNYNLSFMNVHVYNSGLGSMGGIYPDDSTYASTLARFLKRTIMPDAP